MFLKKGLTNKYSDLSEVQEEHLDMLESFE
jgi:hypothetical protein